jgi:hypothetical protein
MVGCPLLVAGCFLGEQFLFPVPKGRGPFVVLSGDGGFSFAAGLLDLLVEVTGGWRDADPLLDGGQPRLDGKSLWLDRVGGQQLGDPLADPVKDADRLGCQELSPGRRCPPRCRTEADGGRPWPAALGTAGQGD